MFIGVCGPSGAGKDTVSELLADKMGYIHVSGGDILREMLMNLGLEPKKSAIGSFSVFIRDNYGLEPLFKRVMQKAKGANSVIISGIRSPDEARLVQAKGGTIVYVDAEAKTRYGRIVSRSRKSDINTFGEFERLEKQERAGIKGTEQNLDSIRSMADVVVTNDGTLEELKRQVLNISTK